MTKKDTCAPTLVAALSIQGSISRDGQRVRIDCAPLERWPLADDHPETKRLISCGALIESDSAQAEYLRAKADGRLRGAQLWDSTGELQQ